MSGNVSTKRKMKVRVILDLSVDPEPGETITCHENARFSKMAEIGPANREPDEILRMIDGLYGDASEALEKHLNFTGENRGNGEL